MISAVDDQTARPGRVKTIEMTNSRTGPKRRREPIINFVSREKLTLFYRVKGGV